MKRRSRRRERVLFERKWAARMAARELLVRAAHAEAVEKINIHLAEAVGSKIAHVWQRAAILTTYIAKPPSSLSRIVITADIDPADPSKP